MKSIKVYKTKDDKFIVKQGNNKGKVLDIGVIESFLFILGVNKYSREIFVNENWFDISLSNYWEFKDGVMVTKQTRKDVFILN